MNKTVRRYIVSSLITFVTVTGFSIVLATEIDNITIETIKNGSVVSVVFVCLSAGLKAVTRVVHLNTTHSITNIESQ